MSDSALLRRIFLSHAWEGDAPHPALLRLLKAVGIEVGPKTLGWIPAQRTFAVKGGATIRFEVFLDARSLHYGAGLSEALARHLGEAHLLAAAWSERYPTRAACLWEYMSAFFADGGAGTKSGDRVRVWPVDKGEVWESIRPRPDVQERLFPDLLTSDPEEVWQGLAEECAGLEDPMTLGAEEDRYVYGGGSSDYSGFVGRVEALWRLYDALHTPGNAGAANLTGTAQASRPGRQGMVQGLGGIGKSLLSRVYARLFAGAYPGGIYWLEALGHNDAGANLKGDDRHQERGRQLRGVADALEISIPDDADERALRSLLGRALKTRGPYLWVVDDYPTRPAKGETIEQWIAPSSNGASLVTSRSRVAMQTGTEILLGVLPPEEAFELLTREAEPVGEAEEAAARGVCESLGCHPLALAVTSARMPFILTDTPYQTLWEELEAANKAELLHAYADSDLLAQLPEGHEASILLTLKRSVDLLSEEGRALLRVASVVAPAPIPVALLTEAGEGGGDAGKALMQAAKAGLVRMGTTQRSKDDGGTRTVEVHTLVAHTAAVGMTEDARTSLEATARRAVLWKMTEAEDGRRHRTLSAWAIHGRALVDESKDGLNLLGWLGLHAHVGGDFTSARLDQEKEWKARARLLGEEHPHTLTNRNNLAQALKAQGDLTGARGHQEAVFEARARLLGEEHPSTLTSRNNLASTLYAQGDLSGARGHHEAVFEASARLLGEEHPDTLRSRNNLASTLYAQGDLSGARGHQEAVFEASARLLGEEHPDTLRSRLNLAATLLAQGDLTGARGHLEAVFEAYARLLGEEHPHTLTSRLGLAATLSAQGDLTGARGHQEAVLEARARLLGPRHEDTTIAAWNLLGTLEQLGAVDALAASKQTLEWLDSAEPARLSHAQRQIRDMLAEKIERG